MHIIRPIIIIALLLLPALAQAEYTVTPAAPFERQFNFEINPGDKTESAVIVKNLGNTSLKANLYSADATHSNMGTFAITAANSDQRHIGTWIKFANPTTIIPPKEEVTLPFTIQIPKNATPGNFAGGIAVEATPLNDTQTFIQNGDGELEKVEETKSQVKVTSRFITKIFINIPGEKKTAIEWTGFNYFAKNNGYRPSFTFSFKNTGNTIVTANPVIRLSGFPPLETTELKLPTITLQPGAEISKIEERWNSQPSIGIYSAKTTVTFSEFDIAANQNINPWELSRAIPLINLTPWYIIAIIILIILGTIALIAWNIIQKKIYLKNCYIYTVREGETLIDIANDHHGDWKKIIRTNKLKPPFALQKGQKLLVPIIKK